MSRRQNHRRQPLQLSAAHPMLEKSKLPGVISFHPHQPTLEPPMPAHSGSNRIEDYQPSKIEYIDGHPVPPPPPIQPLHALMSVFRLLRNKEDTAQVFEAVSALSGKAGRNTFARFLATPYGKRVVETPIKLEEVLSDREALRRLPEGSVGRVYLDFMEGENLTPDGLIDAAEEAGIDFRGETDFDGFRRMFLNLDVCHDLWHVVTGYGRDALGELCNLIYTYEQTKNKGFLLIVFIGAVAQKLEQPRAKIISSLMEARRNAKASEWIIGVDVEELLALPLAEARDRLRLGPTPVYDGVPDAIKRSLLQPKAEKTAPAATPVGAAPAE
jgi:ubiquinone biosynthesis protein COQ4